MCLLAGLPPSSSTLFPAAARDGRRLVFLWSSDGFSRLGLCVQCMHRPARWAFSMPSFRGHQRPKCWSKLKLFLAALLAAVCGESAGEGAGCPKGPTEGSGLQKASRRCSPFALPILDFCLQALRLPRGHCWDLTQGRPQRCIRRASLVPAPWLRRPVHQKVLALKYQTSPDQTTYLTACPQSTNFLFRSNPVRSQPNQTTASVSQICSARP